MAQILERTADASTPEVLGRHLRQVRRKQGLSRADVARSAGLTRRELAAYERGRTEIPESDLWCLAGSCGVDVAELLPERTPLAVGGALGSLAVGDSIRHLRGPDEPDGLLREYLAMIYELRNLPPGSSVPLREQDLVSLADALGGSPDAIEARLVELIGASQGEAARLRAMIVPALPSGAAVVAESPHANAPDPYATLDAPPTLEVADFFSVARAESPFAPLPPIATDGQPVSAAADERASEHSVAPDREHARIAWAAPDASPAESTEPIPSQESRREPAGGAWRIGGIFPATASSDDEPSLRRADARWTIADDDVPGDFAVESTVDFIAGAGFGILFRATVDDQERVSAYSLDADPVAGGGGYVVRQWEANRQHWRPLAHAPVAGPGRLTGRHTIRLTVSGDELQVVVDADTVLTLPDLSRAAIDLGRQPCRGGGVGIQAWATTDLTVEAFRVAHL